MKFPHLTVQVCTIDGSWQGDESQIRFTGTISSSAPFVILSLLKSGNDFHYTKHRKSNDLEALLTLYQSKFPHDNRYQHHLMVGHAVNTGSISEGRLFIHDELPVTFHSGHLFTLATDSQNQPFIYLLAIARMDIKPKRNGIWALKPRLLEGIDGQWLHIFSKTRHGFIGVQNESALYFPLK